MVWSARAAFIFFAALGNFVTSPAQGRTLELTVGVRESKAKVVRNDNVTSLAQRDLGVGLFGGPSFKFLVAKDCKASGPCNIVDDPVTFIAPIVIGADYRVIEHFAFEVFYKFTPGEIWTKNFSQGQTAGINFKYLY
jgi:hypothetical protein